MDGDDSLDGKSWANAKATIQSAVWGVPAGDTLFIAVGVYNQKFSVQDGMTVMGGYDASTGKRDIEKLLGETDGFEYVDKNETLSDLLSDNNQYVLSLK